jgi:hypothetical protein
MAKEPTGKKTKPVAAIRIRWAQKNRVLIGAGFGAILVGYLLLARGDITAAPVLLVVGYCVLIPLAFIV